MLPKLIYLFGAIPSKLPRQFFTELEKIYNKVNLEKQKIKNIKGNNEEKCEGRWPSSINLKLYYKAEVIKKICSD